MAIRVISNINLQIFADTSKKDCLFNLSDDSTTLTMDSFEESNSGRLQLAASAAGSIPLGGIAAGKGVFIQADQDLDIVLNGGSDTLQLRKHAASTTSAPTFVPFFFMGEVTSVAVTNASSTESVNITYAVFGDPTA